MQLTIFTPTYNRAYRLSALYESLRKQTCKDFEWLVIDDGSTDGTGKLFETWKEETTFSVRYLHQKNGGKHRAINKGVLEAKGELFFIVDSDDELSSNAVESILLHYNIVRDRPEIAGVCGMKVLANGMRVGGNVDFGQYECSLFDFRYKYGIFGDLAEAYRKDILVQYPFPDVEGENFCPETLVWHQIAARYKLLFFNENIYICEYLPDGLSFHSVKNRINSPKYAMLTYEIVWNSPISFKRRVRGAISFWRFYYHAPQGKRYKGNVPSIFKIPGWAAYVHDLYLLHKIDS